MHIGRMIFLNLLCVCTFILNVIIFRIKVTIKYSFQCCIKKQIRRYMYTLLRNKSYKIIRVNTNMLKLEEYLMLIEIYLCKLIRTDWQKREYIDIYTSFFAIFQPIWRYCNRYMKRMAKFHHNKKNVRNPLWITKNHIFSYLSPHLHKYSL